jgi:hypothetical protein
MLKRAAEIPIKLFQIHFPNQSSILVKIVVHLEWSVAVGAVRKNRAFTDNSQSEN